MKNFGIACAGFALLLATPVFADDVADAAEAAALKAINLAMLDKNAGIAKVVPGSQNKAAFSMTSPPLIGTLIIAGAEELSVGLPCFYCAPAPGGGYGVGLTIPMGYIPTSQTTLDYSYMFEDVSVSANCTLGFAITQGTTVLDSAAFSYGLYPGTWVITFPRYRPAASGTATIHGLVSCSGRRISLHMNVFLQ